MTSPPPRSICLIKQRSNKRRTDLALAKPRALFIARQLLLSAPCASGDIFILRPFAKLVKMPAISSTP